MQSNKSPDRPQIPGMLRFIRLWLIATIIFMFIFTLALISVEYRDNHDLFHKNIKDFIREILFPSSILVSYVSFMAFIYFLRGLPNILSIIKRSQKDNAPENKNLN